MARPKIVKQDDTSNPSNKSLERRVTELEEKMRLGAIGDQGGFRFEMFWLYFSNAAVHVNISGQRMIQATLEIRHPYMQVMINGDTNESVDVKAAAYLAYVTGGDKPWWFQVLPYPDINRT